MINHEGNQGGKLILLWVEGTEKSWWRLGITQIMGEEQGYEYIKKVKVIKEEETSRKQKWSEVWNSSGKAIKWSLPAKQRIKII